MEKLKTVILLGGFGMRLSEKTNKLKPMIKIEKDQF